MHFLLIIIGVAFLSALGLTPLFRNLAVRWGMVDRPDQTRKIHSHPIPRLGGVAIAIACLISFGTFLILSRTDGRAVLVRLDLVWKICPAALLVFTTGLVDDIVSLKPWHKLVGQVAAALLLFFAGIQFASIGGHQLPVWCALPATVAWIVGCTNAFNLIDGIDGLATGVGLFATVAILFSAILQHNMPLALATAPLAGALLGFLRHNFNPASIFLGDCGSLLIGFLLGSYSLIWSEKSATVLGMAPPLMVLVIPLLDTGLSIGRRFLRCKPIFAADRGHIHHKLLALGLDTKGVVLLIYAVCGLSAALSLLVTVVQEPYSAIIVLVFCFGLWIGIEHLGYPEFHAVRRMFLRDIFRRTLNAELELAAFRDNLEAAVTPEQCWHVLLNAYTDFGFSQIQLKLGEYSYSASAGDPPPGNTWTMRITLSETEHLDLSREFGLEATPLMGVFTDTAVSQLQAKFAGQLAVAPATRSLAAAAGFSLTDRLSGTPQKTFETS